MHNGRHVILSFSQSYRSRLMSNDYISYNLPAGFKNMALIGSIITVILLFITGCSSTKNPSTRLDSNLLIEVSIAGGAAPSAAQVTSILKALTPDIEKAGYNIVETRDRADYILAVRFVPDGHLTSGGRVTETNLARVSKARSGARHGSQVEQMQAESDRAVKELLLSVPTS